MVDQNKLLGQIAMLRLTGQLDDVAFGLYAELAAQGRLTPVLAAHVAQQLPVLVRFQGQLNAVGAKTAFETIFASPIVGTGSFTTGTKMTLGDMMGSCRVSLDKSGPQEEIKPNLNERVRNVSEGRVHVILHCDQDSLGNFRDTLASVSLRFATLHEYLAASAPIHRKSVMIVGSPQMGEDNVWCVPVLSKSDSGEKTIRYTRFPSVSHTTDLQEFSFPVTDI